MHLRNGTANRGKYKSGCQRQFFLRRVEIIGEFEKVKKNEEEELYMKLLFGFYIFSVGKSR